MTLKQQWNVINYKMWVKWLGIVALVVLNIIMCYWLRFVVKSCKFDPVLTLIWSILIPTLTLTHDLSLWWLQKYHQMNGHPKVGWKWHLKCVFMLLSSNIGILEVYNVGHFGFKRGKGVCHGWIRVGFFWCSNIPPMNLFLVRKLC